MQISTRTPHAGSDLEDVLLGGIGRISTRTPHAGSDLAVDGIHFKLRNISTRTPHAGSDLDPGVHRYIRSISTRTPHAGSDVVSFGSQEPCTHLNPHSPCGE